MPFGESMASGKRVMFKFSKSADIDLLKEIATSRPASVKNWEEIARRVTETVKPPKPLSRRAVRERFEKLVADFKKKDRINASRYVN